MKRVHTKSVENSRVEGGLRRYKFGQQKEVEHRRGKQIEVHDKTESDSEIDVKDILQFPKKESTNIFQKSFEGPVIIKSDIKVPTSLVSREAEESMVVSTKELIYQQIENYNQPTLDEEIHELNHDDHLSYSSLEHHRKKNETQETKNSVITIADTSPFKAITTPNTSAHERFIHDHKMAEILDNTLEDDFGELFGSDVDIV